MTIDAQLETKVQEALVPGLRKNLFVYPWGAPPTTLSTTAQTKVQFQTPTGCYNPSNTKLNFELLLGGADPVGNFSTFGLLVGALSCLNSVKMSALTGGQPFYNDTNSHVVSRLWVRSHASLEDIRARNKIKMVQDGTGTPVTVALTRQYGEVGSFVFLSQGNGSTLDPVGLLSTYSGPQKSVTATAITTTCGAAEPIANLAVPWCNASGGAVTGTEGGVHLVGIAVSTPLRDLGGFFTINKYLPFVQPMLVELTFEPLNNFVYQTTPAASLSAAYPWAGAGGVPVAVVTSFAISNIQLVLDQAGDALSQFLMEEINKTDLVIPMPYIRSGSAPCVASITNNVDILINGSDGDRLRSVVWQQVFNTTGLSDLMFSANNQTGLLFQSYNTYWAGQLLQNQLVNYYDVHQHHEKYLKGSVVQGSMDMRMNNCQFDNFLGTALTDYTLNTADVGLPIKGTSTNYSIRVTSGSSASTLYWMVETQQYLVCTRSGAYVTPERPSAA